MKKITIFILTIFTVATLFAAARPSLDGRAVVADSGTMPRGLFARTVGYLPGDSVTVTNPATGSTIDVLILGAIDPSEGVAILLSPESAEALRIKPDSNVQVKLTKRTGSLDENANGSAVLGDGGYDDSSDSSDSDSDFDYLTEDTSEPEKNTIAKLPDYAEKPAPAYNPVSDYASETSEPYEEYPAAEEKEPEPAYEEAAKVAEKPPVKKAEKPAPVETKPEIDESSYEPVVPDGKAASESEPKETLYEVVPPLPDEGEKQKVVLVEEEKAVLDGEYVDSDGEYVESEKVLPAKTENEYVKADEEPVPFEEEAVPVSDAEKLQPVIIVETDPDSDEETDLQPIIEELPALQAKNSHGETKNEEPVYEELPFGIESEPEVVMNEEPYDDGEEIALADEETDAYQPIVLVPADSNPPEDDEEYVDGEDEELYSEDELAEADDFEDEDGEDSDSDETDEQFAESDGEDSETEEKLAEFAEEYPPEETEHLPVVENPVVTNDWSNYVVPSLKNLLSGFYYVQVATLGNTENINSFVQKYSQKYPVVLVQNASKTAYQVMVGPLSIDEYGSVDEKFKAYGFRDSFVRKIK